MGAFVFGANGSSVVQATAINGKWRKTTTKASPLPVAEPKVIESESAEHHEQIAAAASIADVDSDDVLGLTCGLMNIPSNSGDERSVGEVLQQWLEKRGWQVEMQKVEPQGDAAVKADRYNVFATRSGSKAPRLLFNSHMDTVPPFLPARLDDVNLYGRGACDAKSLIAAQMLAAQKLVESGHGNDVAVLYVVSEETDHSGMKKANELGLNPAHLVVGEPTAMKMVKLQKGILKIQLTRKGVAAHSGARSPTDESVTTTCFDSLYQLVVC
jgi:acetylornithine deacetylase/succinyl-diaminopimelate desuccinylase-like protein